MTPEVRLSPDGDGPTRRVAHDWVEDYCMGRLQKCTRCSAVWWPHLAPPKEECVPASSEDGAA